MAVTLTIPSLGCEIDCRCFNCMILGTSIRSRFYLLVFDNIDPVRIAGGKQGPNDAQNVSSQRNSYRFLSSFHTNPIEITKE